MSSFLFIILILVVVIGVLGYETFIVQVEDLFKDDLNQYEVAKDAKNRVFYCFGQVIQPSRMNESCDIPIIDGFEITRINSSVCSSMNYSEGDLEHYNKKFTYAIVVAENGINCLGKMEMYM